MAAHRCEGELKKEVLLYVSTRAVFLLKLIYILALRLFRFFIQGPAFQTVRSLLLYKILTMPHINSVACGKRTKRGCRPSLSGENFQVRKISRVEIFEG